MTDPSEPIFGLGPRTWTDIDLGAPPLVAVAVGSCEQHGPHLPLDTDTRIAQHLAEALVRRRDDLVLAPTLTVGASGEHQDFPGTLSVGTEVLAAVLVELTRSAWWARGLIVINGHGGNVEALIRARHVAEHEGRRLLVWSPPAPHEAPGDLHAGIVETSVMLAIAPDLVRDHRPDEAHPDTAAERTALIGRLRTHGVRAVSHSGVIGDATGADALWGQRWLARWIQDLETTVAREVANW